MALVAHCLICSVPRAFKLNSIHFLNSVRHHSTRQSLLVTRITLINHVLLKAAHEILFQQFPLSTFPQKILSINELAILILFMHSLMYLCK